MIELLLALLLWNILVFATYAIDKRRAIRGAWRISEKTLMIESLLLGGFGAFLGGEVFRHKTTKWYFRLVWYIEMIIDLAIIWLIWCY
ncbi:TPA: DUF1294 domain-containing protein [Streptococcus agalactiae]